MNKKEKKRNKKFLQYFRQRQIEGLFCGSLRKTIEVKKARKHGNYPEPDAFFFFGSGLFCDADNPPPLSWASSHLTNSYAAVSLWQHKLCLWTVSRLYKFWGGDWHNQTCNLGLFIISNEECMSSRQSLLTPQEPVLSSSLTDYLEPCTNSS